MAAAAAGPIDPPHIPVLLRPILEAARPVTGVWLDGTFGAGGYSRGLLDAGAQQVIAVDRDPLAFDMAAGWAAEYGDRLKMVRGNFADLASYGSELSGVLLDLGVSSMQLDQAERGFSFMQDGPLDMRMSQDGPSAADLVNTASETELADLIYSFGEERASRRIARAIVAARPFARTGDLASVVQSCLPRPKPGQSHPATRTFQAIRIAVNDELQALVEGLMAAERALAPGGFLGVVTFHSIEDRIVKRYFQGASGGAGRANRYAPEAETAPARLTLINRKAIAADAQEIAQNPRARSARLRMARRTAAAPAPVDLSTLGLPKVMAGRSR